MKLYIQDTFENVIYYTALRGVALKNSKHVSVRLLNQYDFNQELKMLTTHVYELSVSHVWMVNYTIDNTRNVLFQQLLANNPKTKFLFVSSFDGIYKGFETIFKNFKFFDIQEFDLLSILRSKNYNLAFLPSFGTYDYYESYLCYMEFGFREASDQILVPCKALSENLLNYRKKIIQKYFKDEVLQKEKVNEQYLVVGVLTDREDVSFDLICLKPDSSFVLLLDSTIFKVYTPLLNLEELYKKLLFLKEFFKAEIYNIWKEQNTVCVEIKEEIKYVSANQILQYLYTEIKELLETQQCAEEE